VDELLPNEERIRWILEKSAVLIEGGAEPVSGLVYPTGTFFPDRFDRTREAVAQLLKRVVKHAGLSDIKIESHVVAVEGEDGGGGCSSGACGTGGGGAPVKVSRVEERGDGWRVNTLANELMNPVLLTTGLVRGISHIFMREAGLNRAFSRRDVEHGVDLCGVLLGFGTLLSNGAYIYKKG
jgi:hypothetical protein